MEAMAMRAFSVFLLLSMGGIRLALTQILPLQNVTRMVGYDATIECRTDSTSSSNQLYWTKYGSTQYTIYDPLDSKNFDPAKYSVENGTTTLVVKKVETDDAATYCCAVTPRTDYCANLIVIESIQASVNPSDDIEVGSAVNLTCLLTYSEPNYSVFPVSADHEPKLSMFMGENEIKGTGEYVAGTGLIQHSKLLSVNRTIEQQDVGDQLVCKVSSRNPEFNDRGTADVTINVPNTRAIITYPNGTNNPSQTYLVNSNFECSGNGYPFPMADWLEGDNGNRSVGPKRGNATWTPPKAGKYYMICSARDTRTRNTTYNGTHVTVVESGQPAAQTQTGNKVPLGVGLGIGLGVPILIGIIVLIVVLSRRKKASEPYPVKQPETKSKTATTGKAPNGKNADPAAGPRNNVNPNPNPTYTTPVMPEQTGHSPARNVRDSPGYGDLGVKHIGGSGSNPHLNESFDSKADASFDSAKNYPPGGNIVIKPGRTNHSPGAPNTSV